MIEVVLARKRTAKERERRTGNESFVPRVSFVPRTSALHALLPRWLRKVGRASRHRSPSQINHKGVTIAIVLATLQEMLAVQQEIKSVVTAGHVDTL